MSAVMVAPTFVLQATARTWRVRSDVLQGMRRDELVRRVGRGVYALPVIG